MLVIFISFLGLFNKALLIFPADFYIIDMDDDCALNSTHILLGRPFMKTVITKIDEHKGTLFSV